MDRPPLRITNLEQDVRSLDLQIAAHRRDGCEPRALVLRRETLAEELRIAKLALERREVLGA